MDIGERIRYLRNKNDMTLEAVGKLLGISRQTLQRYESGVISNIPSDKIEKLAEIFNISPAFIMGWENEDGQKSSVDNEIKVIAAHKDGEDWTDEEIETIEMVKEMLRQKRKKKTEK